MGVYTLKEGDKLQLKSDKRQKEYQVEGFREIKGAPVVKFKGVDSINDALKLVSLAVHIPGDSPEIADNTGIEDFTVKDTAGRVWGKVVDIDTATLNQLLEVHDDEDVYYVPFTDAIVKTIDKENRQIVIDPPDGLKDLNKP
jgi:16S rRNA processing protein RimM